jgi:hypothetical protein
MPGIDTGAGLPRFAPPLGYDGRVPCLRRIGLIVGSCATVLVCAVHAQAGRPVLHEYIPNVGPDEAALALSQSDGAPSAIEYAGEVLDAPEANTTELGPAMVATPGDGQLAEQAGQRSPSFRPDRLTSLEDSLDYHDAFNPSIAPFKRVTALDATRLDRDGITPLLAIADPRRRAVRIEKPDAEAPDPRPRDRFWGEATLDFSRGRVVPLPSVSPESRILSLRTQPAVELTVERDTAGNFYAELRDDAPQGNVFVAFLTDAPRSYFGARAPHGPANALASHVPALDASIGARARAFAKQQLGITPASDLADALAALTGYFRAFEESSEPPPDTGDIYLDLARNKKGICRHRAYAFVVTAHALGIPARFVQNEAHSWVEVEVPRLGFMRIDLGGAAHGLTAHNAADKPQYQPAEPDPWPRPAAYEASYSLLGPDVSGMRKPGAADLAGRWVKPDTSQAAAQASDRAAFMTEPDANGGTRVTAPEGAGRTPLSIALDQRHASVQRGRTLHVSGRVQEAGGGGVSGLRIEISLAADDRKERMLLGVTVSAEHGAFDGVFGVPPDVAVGDYRLVVITPGDARHLPALAE